MFLNYVKFKVSNDFIDFIKLLQDRITNMHITNNMNWTENYTKYIILFEGQSKGNYDKIKDDIDINKLYNGFIERYKGILPNLVINDLVITTDEKGKKIIALSVNSSKLFDMKLYLINNFEYFFSIEENILYKKYKLVNGSEDTIVEPLNIIFPIISEYDIKKNVSIYQVYYNLIEIIHNLENTIMGKELDTTSCIFETEHKRAKKIKLW